jgi:diguanylate cyclase (GGDEF)-like protein
VSSADEARLLAQRIIRKISAPYHVAGHTLEIGTSVGIALAPQDGVDLEHLARCADAALYEAKRNGRGAVAFWTEIAERKAEAA